MQKPDPLVELYAVGYLIDAAAQPLGHEQAETLRAAVAELLRGPLEQALNLALASADANRTAAPPVLGMDSDPSDDHFRPTAGNDPAIPFRCVVRCRFPACPHRVVVVHASALGECRCKRHPAEPILLQWSDETPGGAGHG